MKHFFLVVTLLFSTGVYSAPEDSQAVTSCLMCRDEWKKEMESCKSQPTNETRDVCREGAQRNAKKCEESIAGNCSLDLLMEPGKKSEPAKSKP